MITLELRASVDFPSRAVECLTDVDAREVSRRMSPLLASPYLEAPQAVMTGSLYEESGLAVRYENSVWRVTELDFYVALHRLHRGTAERIEVSWPDGASSLDWPFLADMDKAKVTQALQLAIAEAISRGAGPLCTNEAVSRWSAEARSADLPELARVADTVVPALVDRGVLPPHPSALGSIHTRRMSPSGALEWAYALLRERAPLKLFLSSPPDGSGLEAIDPAGPLNFGLENAISEQLGFSPPSIELQADDALPPQVLALRLNENMHYYLFSACEASSPQEAAAQAAIGMASLRPDVLFTIEDAAGLLAEARHSNPSLVHRVLQVHSLAELTGTLRRLLRLHGSLRRLIPLLEDLLAEAADVDVDEAQQTSP